jgi:hypothetical protein
MMKSLTFWRVRETVPQAVETLLCGVTLLLLALLTIGAALGA